MRTTEFRLWTLVSFALLAAVVIISVALGGETRLIPMLIAPPLIAGLGTTPRRTAIVSTLALAAAVALGAQAHDEFLNAGHMLRITVVALASALAVQTAILRERDLRTRRRLNLINASRGHLAAATGVEAALASFAQAAVTVEFAHWAVLDMRLPDGSTVRITSTSDSVEASDIVVRNEPGSAAVGYAADVEGGGPLLLRDTPADLLTDLLDGPKVANLSKTHTMVLGAPVGDLKATYYLICPDPRPPWGEAEVTQAASLSRQAAQRARTDQLIDRITHAQQELSESRDEISAIIGGIASGIIAQRPDGRIVYANDVAAGLLDAESAEAMIGTSFDDVLSRVQLRDEDGIPLDTGQVPSRRALRGESQPTQMIRCVLKSSGEERWYFVRAAAIFDSAGNPSLAIGVIEDNTERRRNEVSQSFVAKASAKLAVSLDLQSTFEALADSAVPSVADWCTIEMLGPRGTIETVACRHRSKDGQRALRAYRDDFPIKRQDDFGPALAISSGVPQLYEQVDRARIGEIYRDDARAEALGELIAHSALSVPITGRDGPQGAITLALTGPNARFTEHDVRTVTELGRRAGISIDNARLHTERMRMLGSLQKSLIPEELPDLPGLILSAAFRPAERDAEVGGDFYDAFRLPDGSGALVIGDVCGKGPEAAALTALSRYTIRTVAMHESSPETILRELNKALLEQVTDGRFCTLAFARATPREDGGVELETISAGHPLPVVVGSRTPRALGTPGTLLGVVPDPKLPSEASRLERGEALLLYTDGLSAGQTTDDTRYALDLAASTELKADAFLAQRVSEAAIARQEEPNRDDVAILAAVPSWETIRL